MLRMSWLYQPQEHTVPKLAIDNCNCCKSQVVPCVVIPAGVLPKEAICKECDTTGTYRKLATYKK